VKGYGVDVVLRPERADDAAAVARVHRAAFGSDEEPRIVEELRRSGDLLTEISPLAEAGGDVVGHVALSRGRLDDRPAVALGPIGVLPEHQRAGVGAALMHEAIARARAAGEGVIVLLGHPTYYPRFGFVRASRLGIAPPFDAPDEAFMALELSPRGAGAGGRFRYPAAFDPPVH
jgi:putative acetyltransferase